MYCTTADVYSAAGIDSNVISTADVTKFILAAEAQVDRITNTTYWAVSASGTATAGGNTTLTDSGATFGGSQELAGQTLWIWSGTGSGQCREISSHTGTVITVDSAWATNPDTTSKYRVIYSGQEPKVTELFDGDGTNVYFVRNYPFQIIQSCTINSTSVTPSKIYQYPKTGKLQLKDTAEVTYWNDSYPQLCTVVYWYGVYPLPYEVKRYVEVSAALKALAAQIGGTFNDPTSYEFPEASIGLGEPYTNIRAGMEKLLVELEQLEAQLIKYPHFS
jgi:hypothetical protein